MATITKFVDGSNNPPIAPVASAKGIGTYPDLLYNIINFGATGGSVASADVVQVLIIPATSYVHQVMVKVLTAEGATCTASVGDGSGANSWDASSDLNATAGTVTQGAPGTDAYATNGGKYYNTADTIDLTMNNAASTGKVLVMALVSQIPQA